ncbi:SDR family oxidoreductase [Luteibacter sp. 9133]|uniref:SDR family oxidoreductase n=1 Tax=Luteibacter sp. 9133 TaxID=1500891 RepID=UPI0005B9CA41|nr:SDR family oxidoreductase [Luteibacter sp. 9133]
MSKTWFITGTSSGFGRLLTEMLLARGDRVVGTLRQPGALDDLRTRYGDALDVVIMDLTNTASIREGVQKAFDGGRVDIVVNNAGYGLFGAAEEVTDEQIQRIIDTNLIGSIQVIRAAIPRLREQGGGRIVQVSSEGGQIAYPNFSLYHASKWGIEGFVEAVLQEVASFGIDFLIVEPGPSKTDFGKGLVTPEPMAIYDDTPVGELRRGIVSGAFVIRGNPEKMARAMIETVDLDNPPRRLVLGGDAYDHVEAGLSARLEELRTQKRGAYDADDDATA